VSSSLRFVLLAALLSLVSACATPGGGIGRDRTLRPVSIQAAIVEGSACLAAMPSAATEPLFRDLRFVSQDGASILSGCLINPGQREFRSAYVEFQFFDKDGHLVDSVSKRVGTLPAYNTPPAGAQGLPRWMESFLVPSVPQAARAQIIVHALVCAPGDKDCAELVRVATLERSPTS